MYPVVFILTRSKLCKFWAQSGLTLTPFAHLSYAPHAYIYAMQNKKGKKPIYIKWV